ncbi:hypothetical protein PoB_002615100 [Plakobranchus ocellatus]|uniref:Uncharacterized protein n=1 Tax=Plakobranchus ocellatus TaxID=259542 RepID=A0AAV3ZUM0_9GAST|nr:hypothetical protein PoB_002615100 [Plakobranchus ocellatus]
MIANVCSRQGTDDDVYPSISPPFHLQNSVLITAASTLLMVEIMKMATSSPPPALQLLLPSPFPYSSSAFFYSSLIFSVFWSSSSFPSLTHSSPPALLAQWFANPS